MDHHHEEHVVYGVQKDDSALIIQVVILIAGWFCCCVWAAGFAYTKHPNPNVALLAKINAGLFLLGVCCLLCGGVIGLLYFLFAIVIGVGSAATQN